MVRNTRQEVVYFDAPHPQGFLVEIRIKNIMPTPVQQTHKCVTFCAGVIVTSVRIYPYPHDPSLRKMIFDLSVGAPSEPRLFRRRLREHFHHHGRNGSAPRGQPQIGTRHRRASQGVARRLVEGNTRPNHSLWWESAEVRGPARLAKLRRAGELITAGYRPFQADRRRSARSDHSRSALGLPFGLRASALTVLQRCFRRSPTAARRGLLWSRKGVAR